jgi:hypothetical protein
MKIRKYIMKNKGCNLSTPKGKRPNNETKGRHATVTSIIHPRKQLAPPVIIE